MSKNWYVLYVNPRSEKKVAERLTKGNIEVYCPLISEVKQWSDRKKTIEVPLFKSYIFVRLLEKERQLVFNVPGAIRYLFWLGKPAIVKDFEIDALVKWLSNDEVEKCSLSKLTRGDWVSIQNGPMKNQAAIVKEVGATRVRLIIEGMGVVVNIKIKDLD